MKTHYTAHRLDLPAPGPARPRPAGDHPHDAMLAEPKSETAPRQHQHRLVRGIRLYL